MDVVIVLTMVNSFTGQTYIKTHQIIVLKYVQFIEAIKKEDGPGVVIQAYNPSIRKAEAGGLL